MLSTAILTGSFAALALAAILAFRAYRAEKQIADAAFAALEREMAKNKPIDVPIEIGRVIIWNEREHQAARRFGAN